MKKKSGVKTTTTAMGKASNTAQTTLKVEEPKIAANAEKQTVKTGTVEKTLANAVSAAKTAETEMPPKTEKTKTQTVAKKPAARTAAAKKPAAKRTTTRKTTTRKSTAAKTENKKTELFIQYQGNETSESDLMEKVQKVWEAEGKKVSAIKTVKMYIKPEDAKAYFVINEGARNCSTGAVDL